MEDERQDPVRISDFMTAITCRVIDLFRGFHRVFFASGSAELDDAAKRVLGKQFRKADSFPTDLELTITGHTDKKEVPGYREALALGERRAQAVKDYLVSKGLAPERIDIIRDGGFYGLPFAYGYQTWVDRGVFRSSNLLFGIPAPAGKGHRKCLRTGRFFR